MPYHNFKVGDVIYPALIREHRHLRRRFDEEIRVISIKRREDKDDEDFIVINSNTSYYPARFCYSFLGHMGEPCVFCGQKWEWLYKQWEWLYKQEGF